VEEEFSEVRIEPRSNTLEALAEIGRSADALYTSNRQDKDVLSFVGAGLIIPPPVTGPFALSPGPTPMSVLNRDRLPSSIILTSS
jgi:hypothetical protein